MNFWVRKKRRLDFNFYSFEDQTCKSTESVDSRILNDSKISSNLIRFHLFHMIQSSLTSSIYIFKHTIDQILTNRQHYWSKTSAILQIIFQKTYQEAEKQHNQYPSIKQQLINLLLCGPEIHLVKINIYLDILRAASLDPICTTSERPVVIGYK